MNDRSTSRVLSEGVDGGDKLDSDSFDGLGGEENGSGAKRALDFNSMAMESEVKGEDQSTETGEGDLRMEEPEKKWRSSTEIEGKNGNKKKRKSVESPTTKRTTEKALILQLAIAMVQIDVDNMSPACCKIFEVLLLIGLFQRKYITVMLMQFLLQEMVIRSCSCLSTVFGFLFYSLDEEGICKMAFELIFAFDEVISLGHKENVTVAQVKQHCEMESHEEKLHKLVLQSKINETKDHMKRKASKIEKSKVAPDHRYRPIAAVILGL
ncbi:Coatomer subunit delta [Morella rubra]|uniref:Coatomer subunit delta n=1 Tax=Morella rubra TaxID=262757 RepID=A0A6A1WQS6_9ROSI|nr:Coatomer subunit delta [Morella rubra]